MTDAPARPLASPAAPEAADGSASGDAIAALSAHPRFPDAMRASAAGIVAMYQGSRLLNWLMDDRGRLVFGYFAAYLDFTRDPSDPSSGLTPTRMKALCAECDLCSAGRVVVMLSLMRAAGYLTPEPSAEDRRRRRLRATDRLIALLRERWRVHFDAMAPLLPDGEAMLEALDDPAFARALILAMGDRFRQGFRLLRHAPGLDLFGERNAGILILASLLATGEADDTMPPSRAVPISISALARRFAVSRPHVLKLLRDAAARGLIERSGQDGDHVIIRPPLAAGAQTFFATLCLFFADGARRAMREIETRREVVWTLNLPPTPSLPLKGGGGL
jgi:DNA-binding MarR family transcriptional regulator